MRGKLIIAIFIIIFSIVNVAVADELEINEVDAYLNGKFFSEINRNTRTLEVEAGDELVLSINLENTFSRSSDIGINGIELEVTIEGIRDGGDLFHESENFGLDSGEDDDREVKFIIPLVVANGEYEIEINAQGFDDSGREHIAEEFFDIITTSNKRKISLESSLDPETVKCGEASVLNYKISNLGSERANVIIKASNTDLNFAKDRSLTLDNYLGANMVAGEFTVDIPSVAEGNYPVEVSVIYVGGEVKESINLNVECDKSRMSLGPEVKYSNGTIEVNQGKEKNNNLLYILIIIAVIIIIIFILIILAMKK